MAKPAREALELCTADYKDRLVLRALESILPALIAVLFAHFVYAWVTLEVASAGLLATISLTAVLTCALAYSGIRSGIFGANQGHLLAVAISGVVLVNTLAYVGLASETSQLFIFWLFRVLSGRRSQIEFPTVEVDGVDEVLLIAETARRGLDPLNP